MARSGAPSARNRGRPKREPMSAASIAQAAAMKRTRESAGMTQKELADLLDVTQGSISSWEQAKKPIPEPVFQRLMGLVQQRTLAPPPEGVPGPGEFRGNRFGEPTATADVPPDLPPDVQVLAGQIEDAMQRGVALDPKLGMLVPDVAMVYSFTGQLAARFTPAGGAVIQAEANALAISLVAAAEENAFVKRVVELMQVGPVSTCVILHLTVSIKFWNAWQEEQKVRQAEAEAAVAASSAGNGQPVGQPTMQTGFGAAGEAFETPAV